jgi:heat shock protein HslJ
MNSRLAITIAVLGVSLAACSAIGARPSGSAAPSPADPSPSNSATAPATSTPAPTNTAQPSSTATAKLDGRQFVSVLVTENGKSKQLVTGTRIRLGFSDGSLSAYAGCNHMSGDYKVVDGRLTIGDLATTEIGCPANLAAQDEWLAQLLGSNPTVTVADNPLGELSLENDTTKADFQDREIAEPDQPLTGITWTLTSLLDGEAASSVPEGVVATLLFKANGDLQAAYGCNSGGGKFNVEGDTITFSEMLTTDMACTDDRGAVESAVLEVVRDGATTYEIDHTTLTLTTADGHGLMYAAAVDTTDSY